MENPILNFQTLKISLKLLDDIAEKRSPYKFGRYFIYRSTPPGYAGLLLAKPKLPTQKNSGIKNFKAKNIVRSFPRYQLEETLRPPPPHPPIQNGTIRGEFFSGNSISFLRTYFTAKISQFPRPVALLRY